MAAFYTALELSALFAAILLPLVGPKKHKATPRYELSSIAVNENGYLEYITSTYTGYH